MLRSSTSRVLLLLVVLVAHGFADHILYVFVYVYVMFACVLVTVNILNFNMMCLGRSSRSCCRFNIMVLRLSIHSCVYCSYLYAFLVVVFLLFVCFWCVVSCLAPVLSGLGSRPGTSLPKSILNISGPKG